MRVAMCFSGQLRNVKSTYEGWWKPNVFNWNTKHEVDFFAHSWFDDTTVGTQYYAANHIPDAVLANAPIPNDIVQQVYDCYNPIKLLLQRQVIFDEKDYNERKLPDAVPKNGISRMYSMRQANLLKLQHELENGFRYDVVMFTRYDFTLKEPWFFDSVLPSQPGVYHPGHSPFNVCGVMGDNNSMDQYAELYLHYDTIYRMGTTWVDEHLARDYLNHCGIRIYDLSVLNGLNRTGG